MNINKKSHLQFKQILQNNSWAKKKLDKSDNEKLQDNEYQKLKKGELKVSIDDIIKDQEQLKFYGD